MDFAFDSRTTELLDRVRTFVDGRVAPVEDARRKAEMVEDDLHMEDRRIDRDRRCGGCRTGGGRRRSCR